MSTKKMIKGFGSGLLAALEATSNAVVSAQENNSRYQALSDLVELRRAELVAAQKQVKDWHKANPAAGFWAQMGSPTDLYARQAYDQAVEDLRNYGAGVTT